MLKSSLLAMIALSASGAPTFAAENRLVPGKSAGEISIGETMNAVSKKLGQSDSGDGAMGHFWATWSAKSSLSTAKPNSLEIYAVRTRTGAKTLVEQIRVTSPWFSTPNGTSTRSSLAQIQRRFPDARAIAFYNSKALHKRVTVYDDIAQGIGFEISDNGTRCLAITIHRSGHKMTQIYSARHDYHTIK